MSTQPKFMGLCLLSVGLLVSLGCLEVKAQPAAPADGVVLVNQLNMRAEPNIHGPRLLQLEKGTTIHILNRCNGWLQIVHEGRIGYVKDHPQFVRLAAHQLSANNQLPQLEEHAAQLSQQIAACQSAVEDYRQQAGDVLGQLQKIEISLAQGRQTSARLATELDAMDGQIQKTSTLLQTTQERITAGEAYAVERMVALYKLSRLGQMHLLASSASLHDLLRRRKALKRIIRHDDEMLANLASQKQRHEQLLQDLNRRLKAKKALENQQRQQLAVLEGKRVQRAQLLEAIRSQEKLQLAAIDALKQAARDLDRAIAGLRQNQHLSAQTGLSGPTTDFNALKGLLKPPVKGKIIANFGPYTNQQFNVTNYRSGVDIKAERGEPIRAVGIGKVVFADWFRGYGNLIIIDHGHNFHTIYAHAEELFKSKGDHVDAGEVIATVGDTGSLNGTGLYFEVRHQGKALDPLVWLDHG